MKNVTISLDERLARWARVKAAEQDKSLSRFLADLLEQLRKQESNYEAARRRFKAGKPFPFREPGERLPSRDEIYDRKVFRR
jgi:hypothetical protein